MVIMCDSSPCPTLGLRLDRSNSLVDPGREIDDFGADPRRFRFLPIVRLVEASRPEMGTWLVRIIAGMDHRTGGSNAEVMRGWTRRRAETRRARRPTYDESRRHDDLVAVIRSLL